MFARHLPIGRHTPQPHRPSERLRTLHSAEPKDPAIFLVLDVSKAAALYASGATLREVCRQMGMRNPDSVSFQLERAGISSIEVRSARVAIPKSSGSWLFALADLLGTLELGLKLTDWDRR